MLVKPMAHWKQRCIFTFVDWANAYLLRKKASYTLGVMCVSPKGSTDIRPSAFGGQGTPAVIVAMHSDGTMEHLLHFMPCPQRIDTPVEFVPMHEARERA